MTGNEAILDLGGAHVQAQHIGDLAAPVLAARAWTTLGPPMPQTRNQILAQAATGHGVECGVDGFVRHGLARSMTSISPRREHAPTCRHASPVTPALQVARTATEASFKPGRGGTRVGAFVCATPS